MFMYLKRTKIKQNEIRQKTRTTLFNKMNERSKTCLCKQIRFKLTFMQKQINLLIQYQTDYSRIWLNSDFRLRWVIFGKT